MPLHSLNNVHVVCRGIKSQELDTPAIEKRFAYTFLQQLITYVDQAHQHMMEFGELAEGYTERNDVCLLRTAWS